MFVMAGTKTQNCLARALPVTDRTCVGRFPLDSVTVEGSWCCWKCYFPRDPQALKHGMVERGRRQQQLLPERPPVSPGDQPPFSLLHFQTAISLFSPLLLITSIKPSCKLPESPIIIILYSPPCNSL